MRAKLQPAPVTGQLGKSGREGELEGGTHNQIMVAICEAKGEMKGDGGIA